MYHAGWVGAWSIRRIKQMIDRESLFIAVKSYGVRVGDSVMADSLYYPNQKEKVGVVFELGKRGAFVAFPNDKFRWFFMYEDLRKVSE